MKQGIYIIRENRQLTPTTWLMKLEGDVRGIKAPGQFINIRLDGHFLRRPISICDARKDGITIIYKVLGHGTEEMTHLPEGETLDVLTGLGNGYDIDDAGERPLLIGGGVGIPPLYLAARCMEHRPTIILGFNNGDEIYYVEEFEKLPDVIQRSIGGPEQLKAWAQMDAATVESVVASNFMRTFKAKRKQQKELEMMPTEVKNYMAAVADKMQIGGPEHKKLEEPKQRAIEAPKLETMVLPDVKKNLPKPDLPTPKPYKAPSGADWEKKREEAMEKLNAVKKTKEASANG